MSAKGKKGEMSLAFIIGAVIAIVILVIIIFLIARSTGDTNKSTSCPSKGGVCTEYSNCNKQIVDDNGVGISCANSGEVCCSITAMG